MYNKRVREMKEVKRVENRKIGVLPKVVVTAAAAYGAYKLAYHLTTKKGTRREWHRADGETK